MAKNIFVIEEMTWMHPMYLKELRFPLAPDSVEGF